MCLFVSLPVVYVCWFLCLLVWLLVCVFVFFVCVCVCALMIGFLSVRVWNGVLVFACMPAFVMIAVDMFTRRG